MTTTDETRSAPPVPVPDALSAEFWRLAAQGTLATQRCTACGWRSYPPRMVCANCHADPPAFEWAPVSGRGRLATWTVIRNALLPGFADLTPYVVAEVELEEQDGLRIVARLPDVPEDALAIGLPLTVEFIDGGEGAAVPVFARTAS